MNVGEVLRRRLEEIHERVASLAEAAAEVEEEAYSTASLLSGREPSTGRAPLLALLAWVYRRTRQHLKLLARLYTLPPSAPLTAKFYDKEKKRMYEVSYTVYDVLETLITYEIASSSEGRRHVLSAVRRALLRRGLDREAVESVIEQLDAAMRGYGKYLEQVEGSAVGAHVLMRNRALAGEAPLAWLVALNAEITRSMLNIHAKAVAAMAKKAAGGELVNVQKVYDYARRLGAVVRALEVEPVEAVSWLDPGRNILGRLKSFILRSRLDRTRVQRWVREAQRMSEEARRLAVKALWGSEASFVFDVAGAFDYDITPQLETLARAGRRQERRHDIVLEES